MKFIYTLLFLMMCVGVAFAQTAGITGSVEEAQSGKPVIHATVQAGTVTTTTADDGTFELKGLSKGDYTVTISKNGYETVSVPVKVTSGNTALPPVQLTSTQSQGESGIAELTVDTDNGDNDASASGLLHSSSDVYVNAAAYIYSSMFFKTRGYASEYENVYIEGIPFNDAESGRAVWSEWGGLNDVMRNREYVDGITPALFTIGGLDGSSYITLRASKQRKQTKFSYSLSNRSYTNRAMFTYSSGLLKNNWAFTVSGSRRWSQEGYVEGTFYDAYSWFVGAEKKINNHHSIAFSAFASPARRGMNASSVQEVYDLMDNNYYNANWGYQNGEKRNARVRKLNEPKFLLSHYWTIDDKSQLTTTFAYSFGTTGTTGLNWYNSSDPRPDYYRYLPNYQQDPAVPVDPAIQQLIADAWKNDPSVSQINWDKLYQINYLTKAEGKQARYILENVVTAQKQLDFSTRYNRDLGEHLNLSAGLEANYYRGSHYKVLEDMLGAEFWVDIDQFSERDFKMDKEKLQNDLNNPDRKIYVGDRFGFDYDLVNTSANIWGLLQWTYRKFDFYTGLSAGLGQYYREGYMRNGRMPDNSYGKSEKQSTNQYNLKVGSTYKISGRHFVVANGAYMSRPPLLRDAYISPRSGDQLVPGIGNENILAGDLSFIVRYPEFNARVTLYETSFTNHTEIRRFYADDLETFVNMALYPVNKVHQGIEVGGEVKVLSFLKVFVAGSIGNYRYTNRPTATVNYDNGAEPDTSSMVYIKNFYVGGTPQTVGTLGLKFNKNYWFVDLSATYYDKIWLDFNPMRRTQAAIANLAQTDPLIKTITQQEKLEGGMTLDGSIGKSIRIKYKYFININFSVNNILNNTSLISGGYEQNRFDYTHEYLNQGIDKFPPKYFYSYGRTYFLNVGFRF